MLSSKVQYYITVSFTNNRKKLTGFLEESDMENWYKAIAIKSKRREIRSVLTRKIVRKVVE